MQYVLLPSVWMWVAVVSLLLMPVHALAKKSVYKKVSEGEGGGTKEGGHV